MNRELVVVLIWVASLTAVGWWQRSDGAAGERLAWQERDNEALRRANETIVRLNEAARDAEHRHAGILAAVSTELQRRQDDGQTKLDAALAAVRAGTLKLRDPAGCGNSGRREAGQAGAGAGERDAAAGGELSGEATEFLFREGRRADAVVEQLTACQQVIIEDRRLCGQ